LLHYGRELNAMDQVIGIMLVIVVIGLLADKILFSLGSAFCIAVGGPSHMTTQVAMILTEVTLRN